MKNGAWKTLLTGENRLRLGEELSLRLLSVWEVLEAEREAEHLADEAHARALCSNACILARALERGGQRAFPDGAAVLRSMCAEEIDILTGRWAAFNQEENPSPACAPERLEQMKDSLEHTNGARLRWHVLRAFGALPTEERARQMKDRDYLWCALNLLLDDEEELQCLCPACRAQALERRCPVCGAPAGEENGAENPAFDPERYERLRRGETV